MLTSSICSSRWHVFFALHFMIAVEMDTGKKHVDKFYHDNFWCAEAQFYILNHSFARIMGIPNLGCNVNVTSGQC